MKYLRESVRPLEKYASHRYVCHINHQRISPSPPGPQPPLAPLSPNSRHSISPLQSPNQPLPTPPRIPVLQPSVPLRSPQSTSTSLSPEKPDLVPGPT